MNKRKKLGLALGSGAVRGLAHIGVIKSLIKNNIPIDYIAGTSIGACVGAHYALYKDINSLQKIATEKKKEKLFTLLDPARLGGLVSGVKMEKLFDSWWNGAEFNDLKIPFQAVATELITGQKIVLNTGSLSQAARASSSIPGFFAPVNYKGKMLIDGAMSCPIPTEIVKKMGADVVIAVNLYEVDGREKSKTAKWSLDKVAIQSAQIVLNSLAKENAKQADFYISPEVDIYSNPEKYFIGKHDLEVIEAGETATDNIIKELKKALAN